MIDPEKLYALAARKREAQVAGRDWLLDVYSHDEQGSEEIQILSAIGIVAAVERTYEGGYEQFLRDSFNLKQPRLSLPPPASDRPHYTHDPRD